jgi:DNA-binding beta-propeller fold protein YncE
LEAIIDTPGHPFASITDPYDRFLFVSVTGANNGVAVYSLGRAGIIKQVNFVPIGSGAYGLAFSPRGDYVFVGDDNGVAIVDAKAAETGRDAAPFQVVDGIGAITTQVIASHDGRYLFASDERYASISIIRLEPRPNGKIGGVRVGAVSVDSTPVGLAISPHDRFLYATSEIATLAPRAAGSDDPRLSRDDCVQGSMTGVMPNGVVTTIDVTKAENETSGAVISRVAAGCSPVRIVLTDNGDTAWVSIRGDDRVIGFNTGRLRSDPAHALIASVAVGPAPVGLAMPFGGGYLVVADSNRFGARAPSTIQFLALGDNPRVLDTIEAGVFPRELFFSRTGLKLFVTNFDSNNVMLFSVQTLVFGSPLFHTAGAPFVPPAGWTKLANINGAYLHSIWEKTHARSGFSESVDTILRPGAHASWIAAQKADEFDSLGYVVRTLTHNRCGRAVTEEWATAARKDFVEVVFVPYDHYVAMIAYRRPSQITPAPGTQDPLDTCDAPFWPDHFTNDPPPGWKGESWQPLVNAWTRPHSEDQLVELAGPVAYETKELLASALLRISAGHLVRTALNVIAESRFEVCGRPAYEARVIVIGQSESDVHYYDVVVTQSYDHAYTLEYSNAGGRFDSAMLDAMRTFCPLPQ